MNEEKRSELLSYFLNEEYGVLPSFSDVHVYYEVVDEFPDALKAHRKDLRCHLER